MTQAPFGNFMLSVSAGQTSGMVCATLLALAPPLTGGVFGFIQGCVWYASSSLRPENETRVTYLIALNLIILIGRVLAAFAISIVLTPALGFPITFQTGLYLTAAMILTIVTVVLIILSPILIGILRHGDAYFRPPSARHHFFN